MEKILNYINGELIEPSSKIYIENIDPSCGKAYSLVPDSCADDVNEAVKSAKVASSFWSKTTKQERSDILNKLADAIEENFDMLVAAESRDNGKPLSLAAKVDIPRASANLRFFAGAILHDSSDVHEMDGEAINYTLRVPIGVAEQKVIGGEKFLTLGDNYILIEFSFLTAPHNYLETIFQLQLKGYKVILAHAERYPYLTESDLEDFINRGVYLQLNILSSIGYYSNNVRERANWLINNNMISFVGTDCHNLNQTKLYDKCKIEPMLSALLSSGKILNDQLM